MLHVDAGKRPGKLAQIARWGADQAAKLAERPVRWRDRLIATRQDQGEALDIVAARFDPDLARLHGAGGGALGAAKDGVVQSGKGEISLIIGTGEPLGRDAADSLAARDIDLEAAGRDKTRRA